MNFVNKQFGVVLCLCLSFFSLLNCAGCKEPLRATDVSLLDEFHNAGPLQPEIDIDKLIRSKSVLGTYRLIPGDLLELQMPSALQTISQNQQLQPELPIPHLCRVRQDGTVNIPVIGKVPAAGGTLPELEARIIDGYYPRYSVTRPSVIGRVIEYKMIKASITGAVAQPGIYDLRNDQRSLVALIMASGGIVEGGAALIRIDQPGDTSEQNINGSESKQVSQPKGTAEVKLSFRQDVTGSGGTLLVREDQKLLISEKIDITNPQARRSFVDRFTRDYPHVSGDYMLSSMSQLSGILKPGSEDLPVSESLGDQMVDMLGERVDSGKDKWSQQPNLPLVLPVKGLNIPFADIVLFDGARVEVQSLDPAVFTVVGLVKKPGAFPYPANSTYNLMQALAFAGGVDEIADPRFVRVYRQAAGGKIVDATFEIKGTSPVGASNIKIKPGDVVAVEQTERTHRNLLMAEILGLRVGATANYGLLQGGR